MVNFAQLNLNITFSELTRWIGFSLFVIYAVGFSKYWLSYDGFVGPTGQPFGHDFYCFWTASRLLLSGQLSTILDQTAFQAALDTYLPGQVAQYPWNYPPTYLILVSPLALLPLPISYFVFMGGTFAAMVWALQRLYPRPEILWLLVMSGVPAMNMAYGQNGFLTATLMALGMRAILDQRVILAGVCIGLLTFKPHLGVLIPFALLAARQYRIFASISICTLVFVGLSLLFYGPQSWISFYQATTSMSDLVADGGLRWWHLPTVYGMLRGIGLDSALSIALQAIVSLLMVGLIWRVWRGGVTPIAIAILMPATILASPYLLVYDLMVMSICVVLWARLAVESGRWRVFEKLTLMVSMVGAILLALSAQHGVIQLTPFAIAVALPFLLRRQTG